MGFVASSTCATNGSTTDCTYAQIMPVIHSDVGLTVVIGAILLLMVAYFIRYAFYR